MKLLLVISFGCFILNALASNFPSEIIWKRILQTEQIVRVKVESVVGNKALVRQIDILRGTEHVHIESIKISVAKCERLGREWIKNEGEYFLLLYNSRKSQKLSELYDKIRIEQDSVVISSRRLIGLPGGNGFSTDLYVNTDPEDRIGYRIPVQEFEVIVKTISMCFKYAFNRLHLKKEYQIEQLYGKSPLLDLLLNDMKNFFN